jgi:hypothetical protein
MFSQLMSSDPVIFLITGPRGVGLGTGLSALLPSPGRGNAGSPCNGGGDSDGPPPPPPVAGRYALGIGKSCAAGGFAELAPLDDVLTVTALMGVGFGEAPAMAKPVLGLRRVGVEGFAKALPKAGG